MRQLTAFLCFLALSFISPIFGEPLFFRGRPVGKKGMVGRPRSNLLSSSLPPDQWFNQHLDHFNPADTRTWKQRYFINDQFYKPGGPVFLQIGGEGEADPIWMVEGQCVNYAKKFGALVLMLEHRYYGNSHPTEDMSVDNLVYLTSEQALADLANFRNQMASRMDLQKNKWIAFGGSYPGSLAAWFRYKYPHLIDGAIASSAPILAIEDFRDYLGVVRDALATTGSGCNNVIEEATEQLQKLLSHRVGWQLLEKTFRLCDKFDATNQNDVANLVSLLAGNVEGVVQYNKDNREFEGAKATNLTIDVLCDLMRDNGTSPLQRYAAVNSLILDSYGQKCLDFKYKNLIKSLANISWNSSASEGGRQWTYQTCVEFGFFQSSGLKNQPFGNYFPAEFFVQQCKDIFGSKFTEKLLAKGINRTNTNYGEYKMKVTKVVFPNGSIDPWHALGVTKDLSSEAVAIYINGTAHCANMYPDSPDDLPQLTEARKKIQSYLTQWLAE